METVFLFLAFIGAFSSGIFCCLAVVFAVISRKESNRMKAYRKKVEKIEKSDKRDLDRPRDVQ